ncbi:head-tail adaptor protein [Sagittula sp. NFXS13]|uniref:phage head completion protein n=1 Tax=Sagittula sp. NFXS13 TaxID=2819095 RepID=UPI0032DEFB6A
MHPDRFDVRVTFQEKRKIPNGGGGSSVQWVELGGAGNGSRWVALRVVKPSKGDEETGNSRIENAVDYTLTVRADRITRTLQATGRVMIDGIPHAIKSLPRPDRRTGNIQMIVQEGQAT